MISENYSRTPVIFVERELHEALLLGSVINTQSRPINPNHWRHPHKLRVDSSYSFKNTINVFSDMHNQNTTERLQKFIVIGVVQHSLNPLQSCCCG